MFDICAVRFDVTLKQIINFFELTLFSFKFFLVFGTVAFSFLFNKYYSIMD
jgi:hypothetical protein